MSMLYVLIPLALGLLGLAVWALLWAIKSGQFDDLESHGWSVVLDDDRKPMTIEDGPMEDKSVKEEKGNEERAATLKERTRASGEHSPDRNKRHSSE